MHRHRTVCKNLPIDTRLPYFDMKIDYSTKVTAIDGTETDLTHYIDNVLLIVNTASRCGYTPQYQGLQSLYERYRSQGFCVLGFPCNQFGLQEPGTEQKIAEFCTERYSVTFPLFSKIKVNGSDTHPLYRQLKDSKHGFLGSSKIQWNFNKFLVGRDGTVLERHGSNRKPEDLAKTIEKALVVVTS